MNKTKRIKIFNDMIFADRLRVLREKNGNISQSDLAGALRKDKLNVSQSRIARIELGAEPYISEVIALAKHFNLTIYELLDMPNSKENDFPVSCSPKIKNLCKKVKNVIESETDYAAALESNIICFEKSVQLEARIENLEKITSAGQDGGTSQKPARATARQRKAG